MTEFGIGVMEWAPIDEVKDLASESNIMIWTGIFSYSFEAQCTFFVFEQETVKIHFASWTNLLWE